MKNQTIKYQSIHHQIPLLTDAGIDQKTAIIMLLCLHSTHQQNQQLAEEISEKKEAIASLLNEIKTDVKTTFTDAFYGANWTPKSCLIKILILIQLGYIIVQYWRLNRKLKKRLKRALKILEVTTNLIVALNSTDDRAAEIEINEEKSYYIIITDKNALGAFTKNDKLCLQFVSKKYGCLVSFSAY